MQDRLFQPPDPAPVRARRLVVEAEEFLAWGWVSESLDATVAELRDLEASHGLPSLFGASRWLDRYDVVLQAYRELPR